MSLYKQKGSDIWWVSLSHPDQPRVRCSTGTADRAEAQRQHDQWKAQLWRQAPIKGHTWGQAVMLWAADPERSESDVLSMQKFGRHFNDRALSKVTAESIERALAFCKTASTYMRYRARIMAILARAKKKGWLLDLPDVPTRTVHAKPRSWITREQWTALYKALPAHQKPMAEFAVLTGLRQANVLGLTWDRVDLERQLVWVESEDMKGKKPVAVPLSARAVEILTACRGAHKTHVFTFRGRPVGDTKNGFQGACVKAGLGEHTKDGYEGFTWHGLRHTWATWHVQKGTPLDVLQKLGAWSDLRMVMNYAHHSPGYLARFVEDPPKESK